MVRGVGAGWGESGRGTHLDGRGRTGRNIASKTVREKEWPGKGVSVEDYKTNYIRTTDTRRLVGL